MYTSYGPHGSNRKQPEKVALATISVGRELTDVGMGNPNRATLTQNTVLTNRRLDAWMQKKKSHLPRVMLKNVLHLGVF